MNKGIFLFVVFWFGIALSTYAQEVDSTESLIIVPEGVEIISENGPIETFQSKDPGHSPKKAVMYSMLLPGLGQAYNEKYWKIPIIYTGIAVVAYGIQSNNYLYRDFRNILIGLQSKDPDFKNPYEKRGLDIDRIQRRMDNYRRDREYMIVFAGLLYALNIVDALVDAHLREFDLSDDLSLKFRPHVWQSGLAAGTAFGVSISFEF